MLHPRARTMLILSVPAILIGIACSLILIVAMKVAALLQRVLWSNLPAQLGVSADSPLWVIAMLTATGIAVGLVIRYSPGHAGPYPCFCTHQGRPRWRLRSQPPALWLSDRRRSPAASGCTGSHPSRHRGSG